MARQHTQRATPHSAQNWQWASCPDIITKSQRPLNSPNIHPVDYHVWGTMLEAYRKVNAKPKKAPNSKKRFRLFGTICHRD